MQGLKELHGFYLRFVKLTHAPAPSAAIATYAYKTSACAQLCKLAIKIQLYLTWTTQLSIIVYDLI